MKKKALFITLFSITTLFAQNYKVLDTADYKQRIALVKEYKTNFKEFKKHLKKNYKGKFRKEVEFSYENLHKDFTKNIEKKRLVFNPIFDDYLNNLSKKIIDENPILANDNLRFFVSRHNSPNAMSLGNGVIIINMGLFKYLENEAQLVSVITHEIAHQKLEHAKKNILYKAKLNTSKEKKNEAKEIRRQKYNQYDKAFEIMKDLLYTNSKKHRKQESEADSLGYEMYKKTNYPKVAFINALGIMAELDTLPSIQLKKETYAKIFDLKEQPFKKEWMKIEDFKSYNYDHYKDKVNKDSLKSHPEMLERIKKIKQLFSNIHKSENDFDNSDYKKLQNIALKEDVANLNYLEKYGLSIYLSLYRLQKNTEDIYYKQWLGKNFNELYKAKKKYQFNRYVDRLVPNKQDESYQQFISFLWNLKLNEIKVIADYYNAFNENK